MGLSWNWAHGKLAPFFNLLLLSGWPCDHQIQYQRFEFSSRQCDEVGRQCFTAPRLAFAMAAPTCVVIRRLDALRMRKSIVLVLVSSLVAVCLRVLLLVTMLRIPAVRSGAIGWSA